MCGIKKQLFGKLEENFEKSNLCEFLCKKNFIRNFENNFEKQKLIKRFKKQYIYIFLKCVKKKKKF